MFEITKIYNVQNVKVDSEVFCVRQMETLFVCSEWTVVQFKIFYLQFLPCRRQSHQYAGLRLSRNNVLGAIDKQCKNQCEYVSQNFHDQYDLYSSSSYHKTIFNKYSFLHYNTKNLTLTNLTKLYCISNVNIYVSVYNKNAVLFSYI